MNIFDRIFRYFKSTKLLIISTGLYVGILLLARISDYFSNVITRERRKKNSHKTSKLRFLDDLSKWRRFLDGDDEVVPIEVIKLTANLSVCTAYVYTTYVKEISREVWILYWIVGTLASIEFLYFFIVSESKVTYTVGPNVRWSIFFNLVSIPSLFIPGGEFAYFNLAFLRIFCAYKSYEIIAKYVETKYNFYFYAKNKDNLTLFAKFFVLIYILAAGYQQAEVSESYVPIDIEAGEWSFFNSIWFIVVTLSTVGYGDFSPSTIQGRAFVMIMIVLVINIGYNEWKDRLDSSLQRHRGQGKFSYVKESDHVIIIGNPTLEELAYFIKEFYALYSDEEVREHGSFGIVRDTPLAHTNKKVVVLLEELRWSVSAWNEMVSENDLFKKNVKVFVGKYDEQKTFERAELESALGVFILSHSSPEKNNSSTDVQFEVDKKTVELALRVRKENPKVPIYSQTLLDESNIPIHEALEQAEKSDSDTVNCIDKKIFKPKKENSRRDPSQVLWDHEKTCLKSVHRKNKVRDNIEPEGQKSVLESYNLSLESFFTSLLVANVKANGLSTLLTNMYFDFGFPDSDTKEPWLEEFHMGSACKILPAFIPVAFTTHSVQSLSPILARRGVILLGLKKKGSSKIKPILKTKKNYPEGAIGFFLTYLDIHDLCIALRLIWKADINLDIEIQKIQSNPTLEPLEDKPSHKKRARWLWQKKVTHFQKEQDAIKDLRGHVIVTMDFEKLSNVTDRLYNFQKLLRYNEEKPSGEDNAAQDTIVVIHPTFWKPSSDDVDIYFVPGNPSNIKTWERANFRHCRAIITMSDKNKKHSEADYSTLFTLMMLDKHTKHKQNIYICSEILREKSLKLFRTPSHPRRTATKLGYERIERSGAGYYRNGSKEENTRDREPSEETASENQNVKCRSCCGINAKIFKNCSCDRGSVMKRAEKKSVREAIFSSVRYSSGELAVYSSASSLLVREYSEPGFIDFVMSLCGGGNEKKKQRGNGKSNTPDERMSLNEIPSGTSESTMDSTDTMYAGSNNESNDSDGCEENSADDERQYERQKVFLLSIPKKVFRGNAEIEYEVIFREIIALGATPLGLYRSGKAQVWLPRDKSRKMRGKEITEELKNFVKGQNQSQVIEDEPKLYGNAKNKLPYVYTLPEMNTKVSEFDGVYVMYDPSEIHLYQAWEKTEFSK